MSASTDINEITLSRYLSGEASPEEAIQVDDWINASPQNKALFESYMQAWNNAAFSPYTAAPVIEAWQQLENALDIHTTNSAPAPVIQPAGKKWLYRYAVVASLILVILLGFYISRWQKKEIPAVVAAHKTLKAADHTASLALSDSSHIVLNREASLTYPAIFSIAGKERNVFLEGEAFFDIATDINRPFVVETKEVNIKVLATAFNVAQTATAVNVQVSSGAILLYNTYGSLTIKAGHSGTYNKTTHQFELEERTDRNKASYATHDFYFEDETLASICSYLEQAFQVKIHLKKEALGQLRMSSVFENKSLDYILEVISASLGIHYFTDKDGTIYFE